MKRMVVPAAAVLALSAGAKADPFAGAYGNTVTQTWPDGTRIVIYVNQNGTWEQRTGAHVEKGTFAWKDPTHACFTTTDPPPPDPAKATGCSEIVGAHKAGDSWTEPTPDGKTLSMSIRAGR